MECLKITCPLLFSGLYAKQLQVLPRLRKYKDTTYALQNQPTNKKNHRQVKAVGEPEAVQKPSPDFWKLHFKIPIILKTYSSANVW